MQSRTGEPASPPRIVADVMTTAVVAAHQNAVFKELALALTRNHVSAVPVIDEQRHVVGVVSESDLLIRIAGDDGSQPWGYPRSRDKVTQKEHALVATDLMTSPAVTTTATTSIADAARLAAQTKVRRLPVVDAEGVLVGIVTRNDLLRIYLRHDDDIRADLVAALDQAIPGGHQPLDVDVDEGVITVAGTVSDPSLRHGVLTAAASIPGVVDVIDRLTVADSAPTGSAYGPMSPQPR